MSGVCTLRRARRAGAALVGVGGGKDRGPASAHARRAAWASGHHEAMGGHDEREHGNYSRSSVVW
eukprot:scaffold81992_cov72-Phaeocystis_antarctica.AAC.2